MDSKFWKSGCSSTNGIPSAAVFSLLNFEGGGYCEVYWFTVILSNEQGNF